MKHILWSIGLLTSPILAGFDFGECSGEGTFQQEIHQYQNYEDTVTVGEIPKGIQGLRIELISDKDVDIRLYAANNDKLVHWPSGLLNGSSLQSISYQDTNITYSGYNGTDGQKGHEFIAVSGDTPSTLTMKAFGYKSGYATVNYSWTGKQSCEEKASGSGKFTQDIIKDEIVLVGEIPKNIHNLEVALTSQKDIDIQLYAQDGTAIVSWKPKGLLSGAGKQSITYQNMQIEWSGYNGTNNHKGNEYIKINGTTNQKLTMKVYGYESGTADVTYSWGDSIAFKDIKTSNAFTWNTSDTVSLEIEVKEDILKTDANGQLVANIVPVPNAVVTLGYDDKKISTVVTNQDGIVRLESRIPSHVATVKLYATHQGISKQQTVLKDKLTQKQTILLERSPEPNSNTLDKEEE